MLTESQRSLLIQAGGCVHTPSPFDACDTCERPPITVPSEKVVAYSFVAQTMDGMVITKTDNPSVESLPLEVVKTLIVTTSDPRIPRITLVVDPDKGERLFRFSRHMNRMGAVGSPTVGITARLTVEVLEVRFLEDNRFLRLYLHPLQGPILSTRDIYF